MVSPPTAVLPCVFCRLTATVSPPPEFQSQWGDEGPSAKPSPAPSCSHPNVENETKKSYPPLPAQHLQKPNNPVAPKKMSAKVQVASACFIQATADTA